MPIIKRFYCSAQLSLLSATGVQCHLTYERVNRSLILIVIPPSVGFNVQMFCAGNDHRKGQSVTIGTGSEYWIQLYL